MPRIGFTMQLFEGMVLEYKRRHDEIWPELVGLLHTCGISEYSIFLNPKTNVLFAVFQLDENGAAMTREELAQHEVMQRWWAYMRELMETNEDGSPVTHALDEVFFMA